MKKLLLTVCLTSAFLVVETLGALPSAAEEPSDLSALVGKWVWDQSAACASCKPFTVVLTITRVDPDGTMAGTFENSAFARPGTRPVKGTAAVASGTMKVAFKFRTFDFDLNYLKRSDTLKGPVSGFYSTIREAEFHREK